MSARRWVLIIGCYIVWCLLNWIPGWQALVLGIPVTWMVVFLTESLPIMHKSSLFLQPARLGTFCFHYFPYFWWQSFKANVDVAYRVLHPRLPIRPGILRFKTAIRSDMGLTILANSISLMPGTTTVDIDFDKGWMYVHCMVISESDGGQAIQKVIEHFETHLKKIFE